MTRTYHVTILEMGIDVLKRDDCIADARRWAKRAFPTQTVIVTPWHTGGPCPACGCRPCAGCSSPDVEHANTRKEAAK